MAKEIAADVDTDPIHRQTKAAAIVIKWSLHIGTQSLSSEKTKKEQKAGKGGSCSQKIEIDS
jgi:hypothetical protein